jgi:hypothetical protein
LSDGKIEIDGKSFHRPTDAATAVVGKKTNGWWFFLTDQASKRSLSTVRLEYAEPRALDTDDDDHVDDEEETN